MDIADKIEDIVDKHAGKIGSGLSLLAGVGGAYSLYEQAYGANAASDYWKTLVGGKLSTGEVRKPEIMNLLGDKTRGFSGFDYLKYKFGFTTGGLGETSAWAAPFWVSLFGYVLSEVGVLPSEYSKPLGKVSKAALITSAIGAIALPGTPGRGPANGNNNSTPLTQGTVTYTYGA